jgi:hypothetical protein
MTLSSENRAASNRVLRSIRGRSAKDIERYAAKINWDSN